MACAIACAALVPLTAAAARRATDPSFQLVAHLDDVPAYFPGLLGNGYIASLTAPRGTEPTQTYLVAFMDYTPGDVSRPALVPGWMGIDFSPGRAAGKGAWLDRVPVSGAHFSGYRQTLDVHDGTLTTRYLFRDHGRDTKIDVVSLVSEASPHLAATRFTITPQFNGWVRLSFPLTIWRQHQPRFPLGRMTGPQMGKALAAHGLALLPKGPATADRAAIWYPGFTQVRKSGGNVRSLSLWLDGKAAYGLPMAMAAATRLPPAVHDAKVTLRRDHHHLALEVMMPVARYHTYSFTKFVAISRSGWGGDAADDLTLARAARRSGFSRLLERQRAAWARLWHADIEIDGDPKAQRLAHSALYYLLASTTADTGWATGPCGLTPCYAGHVFWDSDSWIFPALLLLHPRHAQSLVSFRARTLAAAQLRARRHGLKGAMYPWESDPQYGTDVTPYSARVLSDSEIHVNADVAIAQWQYYLATLDRNWLAREGWPVIRAVARFWASRASYDPVHHRYDIAHVTSVSESHNDIPNDTFTNVEAAKALEIATAAAAALGVVPDPLWSRIARGLYIPVAADGAHHLPFDPAVPAHRGGGPLPLLFLPSLDFQMPRRLLQGDYDYAVRGQPAGPAAGFSMAPMPLAVAADEAGDGAAAGQWLDLYVTGGTLKPPFNVRTETASNNVGPFLTGTGGYVQSLVYGLTGLRVRESGLLDAYPPALPAGWRSMTLSNITFRGKLMTIRVTRGAAGAVQLSGLH
ncbi:MAG: glycoside hydrolase family 65 protein [Proteobacteria bacterium]|nr:glycoside hydrolase family 65 protein [Pseudomonadota bacterium]